MATRHYPGSDEDDLKSLDALAPQRLQFEIAFERFDGRTPKPIAEMAYNDFLQYYKRPSAEG